MLADALARWTPMTRLARAALAAGALSTALGCGDVPMENARLRPGATAGTVSVEGRVAGTGASGLRVRESPTTSSAQIGTLAEGAVVAISCQIEGEAIEGNALWDYVPDEGGYVADAYIVIAAGEPSLPRCDDDPGAPGPAPDGGGTVDIEGPPVQPHVQAFADEACREVGACRATTREGHQPSADLALDFPTGEDYGKLPTDDHRFGDRLADFALANQAAFRIDYVIYRQRINFGEGWEPMEDRGGITQNHYDHVHVSFDP
ncbi:MAG: SH3 domain-containing protein [Labilithrix sp.]|nr:SH3 domain-containing protein [Labilithrix sp.]